jgi:two-component system, sensor histidine kinase LadS
MLNWQPKPDYYRKKMSRSQHNLLLINTSIRRQTYWSPATLTKLFALLICLLVVSNTAAQENFNFVKLQVLEDKNHSITLEDIITNPDAHPFTEVLTPGFAGGFTRSAHWFKFELSPLQMISEQLFIKFQPNILDKIELYLPAENGDYRVYPTGRLTPYNQRIVPYRGIILPVPNPQQTVTAYLRMETTGSSLLFVSTHTPAQFYISNMREDLFFGFYIGLVLLAILITLFQAIWSEEKIFRYYLLYLISALALILSSEGYVSALLFKDSSALGSVITKASIMANIIATTLFFKTLLDIDSVKAPKLNLVSSAVIGTAIIGTSVVFLGGYIEFANLTMIGLVLTAILFILRSTSSSVVPIDSVAQLWYRGIIFIALTGLLGSILIISGRLPGYLPIYYFYHMTLVCTIISFQLLMGWRFVLMKTSELAARKQADALERVLDTERKANDLKTRFLSMIHHEIRTPLSVIRLALGMSEPSDKVKIFAKEAVNNIDAIIERCAYTERLEHGRFNPTYESVDLKALIQHLIPVTAQVELQCESTTFVVDSDAELLKVVFKNLLDNALKYGSPPKKITILLYTRGTGLSADHIVTFSNVVAEPDTIDVNKIFERYIRMPGAEKVSGSGVGLFIVKGILKSLHADIECHLNGNVIEFTICF